MDSGLIIAFSSLVTVALAFWFLYYMWQQYVIDATRQQLFELRDQLFDLASAGKLERDSAVYGLIREMFNSSIRFAHRANLPYLLHRLAILSRVDRRPIREFSAEVKRVVGNIDDLEVRSQVSEVLRHMQLIMAWHMVRVSPVALLILVAATFVLYSIRTVQQFRDDFGNFLNGLVASDAIGVSNPSGGALH